MGREHTSQFHAAQKKLSERDLRHDKRRGRIRAHARHVTWSGMRYVSASSLVRTKTKDSPAGHVWNGPQNRSVTGVGDRDH
jgi:hypothetical protein